MKASPRFLVGILSLVTSAAIAAPIQHENCLVSYINGLPAVLENMDQNVVLFQGLRERGYLIQLGEDQNGLAFEFGSHLELDSPVDGYIGYETQAEPEGATLTRYTSIADTRESRVLFSQSKDWEMDDSQASDNESLVSLKWALKKIPRCEKTGMSAKKNKNSK